MLHIEQIKKALHIDTIGTEYFSWRSKKNETKAQIDLIIERADRIVNVCEMKYSEEEYSLQKDEDMKLRNRIGTYRNETKTNKTIHTTLVTTFGLKSGKHSSIFNNIITMDDLFDD